MKSTLATLIAVAVVVGFTNTANADFVDIGFRVKEAGTVSPTAIAIESVGTVPMSPLRIAKNGVVYGIALVDPSDINATKALIRLAGNVTKALRKFSSDLFPDKKLKVYYHCNGIELYYSAMTVISNPLNTPITFTRTTYSTTGLNSLSSFVIPANSNVTKEIAYTNKSNASNCPVEQPTPNLPPGFADYNVTQGASIIDTVDYSWTNSWFN